METWIFLRTKPLCVVRLSCPLHKGTWLQERWGLTFSHALFATQTAIFLIWHWHRVLKPPSPIMSYVEAIKSENGLTKTWKSTGSGMEKRTQSTPEGSWIFQEPAVQSFTHNWPSISSSLLRHVPIPPKDGKEDAAEMFKMRIERPHSLDCYQAGQWAATRGTDRCHLPSPISKYNCLEYLFPPHTLSTTLDGVLICFSHKI